MEAADVTLVGFFAAAAVALIAGVIAVAGPAVYAARALRVCLIASGCAYVQVMAPVPAMLQVVVLAGAAVAALQGSGEGPEAAPSRWWRGLAAGLVAGLGLVLASTWARQYVWAGRELAAGSEFGSAAAVGAAWLQGYAPALVAGLLVLLVAAIAGTPRASHRL